MKMTRSQKILTLLKNYPYIDYRNGSTIQKPPGEQPELISQLNSKKNEI